MKKTLIISKLHKTSARIPGMAKYLPEFGWQPIIITASAGGNLDYKFRVIETHYRPVLEFWKRLFRFNPNENIRRQVKKQLGITSKKSPIDFFLTHCGEIFNYPDSSKGWKPFAVRAGSELIQKEDIDAIISSSSPVTSHLIAKELKIKHEIPWVADLRDLWSQNHNYYYGPLRRLADRRLELKTLQVADALVTVSEPWSEKLRALHKGKTTYVITNGFDPEEMDKVQFGLTSKFTITYTGSVYSGKQDPSKLFAALQALISDGTMKPNEIEVRFYGFKENWLAIKIEEYGLSAIAKQYGTVPRQISFEKQRESQVLLLLDWNDPREKGCYPLKLFEYLGAKRPIIAVGGSGDNVVRELINETNAGMGSSEIEEIKGIVKNLYLEYKHKGHVAYKGDIAKIDKYSYWEMAKKFAEILDYLTSKWTQDIKKVAKCDQH